MSAISGIGYNNSAMELQTELLAGESLLWSGQPEQSVIFHAQDWYAIPFSFLWGGFAIFWEASVTGLWGDSTRTHSAPGFFVLWGIPFVVMGQYLIWGRFFYTAWKKRQTHYGITNKRILVLNAGSSRRLNDAFFGSLDSVSLTTRQDGIGTIEFSPDNSSLQGANSWGGRLRGNQLDMGINLKRLAFFDVADARTAYQLIQSQRESARKEQ
jgi:hypothetical protein